MADRLPHVDVAGWLLGDLEPDEYDRTSRHLTTCEACRAQADELRATAEWVLTTGPDPQPSPDLADRIVAAIDAEAHPVPVTPPEGLTAADLTRTDLELPGRPAPPTTGRTEPVDPGRPEPIETPVQPDPVQPDPVQPDPVQPDPVQPDPVHPDPIHPDPTPSDRDPAELASDPAADPVTPAAPIPPIPPIESQTSSAASSSAETSDTDDTLVDPTGTGSTDRGAAPTGPGTLDIGRPPGRRDRSRPEDTRAARRELPRWLRPAAAAVAVAALVLVAVVLGTGGGLPGEVELQARLATAGADTTADVTVRRLDSGRAVDVTSDTLPILPDGGIYELWFVGPGDTPEQPNRISAGTFHPDEDGTTDVVLHAAVVPTDYPTVVITAEPNDGDPAVNGDEVVRADG